MRRINNFEKKVLFNQKVKDGTDELTAEWELERDNAILENINYDFKSLQRQVNNLTKENNKLKQLLNKNIIPKEVKVKPIKEIKPIDDYEKKFKYRDRSCSVKYLNRIISYVKESPGCNQSTISKDCVIESDIVKEGLLFLVSKNLIKMTNDGGLKTYG